MRALGTNAARHKIPKQIESGKGIRVELVAYDEEFRQYADMWITLDLDDGT